MYDARRATGWTSVFYFVSLIVLGMMIFMSLFLAILLSNFGDRDKGKASKASSPAETGDKAARTDGGRISGKSADSRAGDNTTNTTVIVNGRMGPSDRTLATQPSDRGSWCGSSPSQSGRWAYPQAIGRGDSDAGNFLSSRSDFDQIPRVGSDIRDGAGIEKDVSFSQRNHNGGGNENGGNGHLKPADGSDSSGGGSKATGLGARVGRRHRQAHASMRERWVRVVRSFRVPDGLYPERALFLFGTKNPLRRGCAAMVTNPGFEQFVLFLILVSSIVLAIDSPLLNPDSGMAKVLSIMEVAITSLFVVEMMLNVCANGFVGMPGAYLRNGWNILDFLVVIVSVVPLFMTNGSGGLMGLRSLRGLRALRPLR